MTDDATTGPIITVPPAGRAAATSAPDTSSFNLVACALGVGALVLSVSTIVMFASLALAFAVVALVLSILGIATNRRHPWAGWVGAFTAGAGVILSVLALSA